MTFSYRQRGPERDLSQIIDAYWINECGSAPGERNDRVLPDGCIDLVFVNHDDPERSRLFSSPLIERPTILAPTSGRWFVGVRMRPAMSQVVLAVAPHECRDRAIDAVQIDKTLVLVEEQLMGCATPSEALAVLRRHVDHRARTNPQRIPPARVRASLRLLSNGPPWLNPHEVASAVGVSPRTLYRDLVSWTGHAPKVLARISRMHRALEHLRLGQRTLAEIACDSGFADQPHMTRELRQLTGLPPSEL